MKKYAIILAAGKGTRMKSEEPKCAHLFAGKPMVLRIVEECKKCNFDDIIVIVGYKKEYIYDILGDSVKYAIQDQQLGTGHAVLCTEGLVDANDALCVVLPGDMPRVDSEIINETINNYLATKVALTVVSSIQPDPTGYGRIYKENGVFKRIIEHKDATDEQRKINEVNSGLYCVDMHLMYEALHQVKTSSVSGEYYFTDIVEIIGRNHKVNSLPFACYNKFVGINDLDTLHQAEEEYLNDK